VPRNSGAEWPSAEHIGNVRRNVLRGPGQSNLDFSVGERFPLAESKALEFHADFFTLRAAFHPSLARGGAEVVGASGLQARPLGGGASLSPQGVDYRCCGQPVGESSHVSCRP
jgi:hypothetical protein